MKKLVVTNFLGVKEAVFELGQRNLICGPNGSGKSSIQNAIRFALCGDGTRIKLKKDNKMLIADGHKTATIDVDGSQTHIMASKTMYAGAVIHPVPSFLLDMHAFTEASPADRSAMINELSGALSDDMLLAAAATKGIDQKKFSTVLPLVRASMQTAQEEAEKQAKLLKAEWKGITGEQWGSEKATIWRPVVDPEAAAKMANLDAKIESVDERLVKLMVGINDEERHVAPLRAVCEGLPQLEDDYAAAKAKMDELMAVVDGYEKELIEDNPWDELCNSLAVVAAAMENGPCLCPKCNASLLAIPADTGNPGLITWGDAEFALDKHRTALADFSRAVGESISAQSAVGRAYQKLSGMRDAKAKLDEVLKGIDPDFNFAAAKKEAEELRHTKNDLFVRKQEIMRAFTVSEQADELVSRAAKTNKTIGEWLSIAEFFAPSGEAAKLLADTMGNLNESLIAISSLTGWRLASVLDDFNVTYGGRDLRLLSESERWRCDAMIAAALVRLSRRDDVPLLLDRIDVLDLEGRGQLIDWCEQSQKMQWIMFGTLKACPNLPTINSFWIENGISG